MPKNKYTFKQPKKGTFKPCPFCGSEDIRLLWQDYGYTVDCQTCQTLKKCWVTHGALGQRSAFISWNRRLYKE